MKELRIRKSNRTLYYGNAPRRRRARVYQILKTNYNHETGDIINTYCIQRHNSKTLDYFVEVCPTDEFEYTISAVNLKECRDIVKDLLKNKPKNIFKKC